MHDYLDHMIHVCTPHWTIKVERIETISVFNDHSITITNTILITEQFLWLIINVNAIILEFEMLYLTLFSLNFHLSYL